MPATRAATPTMTSGRRGTAEFMVTPNSQRPNSEGGTISRCWCPILAQGTEPRRGARLHMESPGAFVKNAGAISWSDVDSREAALIERCTAGDEIACADLVAAHQRMVYGLAFNLLGDRDEALDVSQEVFLRVFRTLSQFRGQSALRTWIYRIVINQVRNRQRWWRRRHRSDLISLDEHLRHFGDVESTREVLPDRLLASKETATRIWDAM